MLFLFLIFAVFAECKSINNSTNLNNKTLSEIFGSSSGNNSGTTNVFNYIWRKIGTFNNSTPVFNATTESYVNNRTNKLFATLMKRVVEDVNDFEVPTSTRAQKLLAFSNTTDPELSKMADRVADDLSSGMLFGNAFLLDKWVVEEPFGLSSIIKKKDIRNSTSDSIPASSNHSMPHLVKRFSLMRKFFFY